jgi:hypothetical protein
MNRPSRSDYYLMRLTALQMASPPEDLNKLKIDLTTEERKVFRWTKEGARKAAELAKAVWFGRLGNRIEIKKDKD